MPAEGVDGPGRRLDSIAVWYRRGSSVSLMVLFSSVKEGRGCVRRVTYPRGRSAVLLAED